MALLRHCEDDEYQPEFSTLVVRDTGRGTFPPGSELLAENAVPRLGGGTIAMAGNGWLLAHVGDEYQRVRLEAHDTEPADDLAGWAAVLETPYGTATGTAELTWLTGRPDAPTVALGQPGRYRVRVARRPADDEGDIWRLQFWPTADSTPPRWLARAEPAALGDHEPLAADLVAVALWSPGTTAATSVAELADRLLAAPDAVREAARLAAARGHVTVTGDLTIAISPPRPTPPPLARRRRPERWAPRPGTTGVPIESGDIGPSRATAITGLGAARRRPPPTPPPEGPPPKAGVVTASGQVMVWRDGTPCGLGHWPGGELLQAVETAYGVVLAGTGVVLARPDGAVDRLAEGWCRVAVSEDGRLVAISEEHHGRKAWARLDLVDLADGSRETVAVDGRPVAVHGGTVYFAGPAGPMRWVPGSAPEPLPYRLYQIDPVTGARLANEGAPHPVVIRPDGSRLPLPPGPQALVPGAAQAVTFGSLPPTMSLYDLTGDEVTSREVALPPDTVMATHLPQRPVWESPDRLLLRLAVAGTWEFGSATLRLDVGTGALERAPADAGARALVTPLVR